MNMLEDQLFLDIHNNNRVNELLNNGAKPNKIILNSYLDNCSTNNNSCNFKTTKLLVDKMDNIDFDTIINSTIRLGHDVKQYNYILDKYKFKNDNEKNLLLNVACFNDDTKYDLVRNFIDKYDFKMNRDNLLKCVRHNQELNKTKLIDKEREFNQYIYNHYKNNLKE